jgi:hypothetical protein
MAAFVTLTCPSCGGKLQITPDLDRFACAHCGNEHIVRRSGGVISLAPLTQEIRQIRTGVDKTAAELAVARLTKEIADLECGIEQLEEAVSVEFDYRLKTVHDPLFVGIPLVGALIGSLTSGFVGVMLGVMAGLGLAAVVYMVLKRRYLAQMEARLAAQIEPLTDRIASRRDLLAKNRHIAES